MCYKEEGHTYITGSVEKLLQKRREVPKEGKERLEYLKARVEQAYSSDALDSIIVEALDIAAPR